MGREPAVCCRVFSIEKQLIIYVRFTVRNVTVNNAQTGVFSLWNWGWTFQGLTINNCQVRDYFVFTFAGMLMLDKRLGLT
jgi:hypothetical protein